MTEWDLTQQILDIEAVKTDAIIQRRLNELGWFHIPVGYVLIPVQPTEKMLEILDFYDNPYCSGLEVYEEVIKAAQGED